MQLKRLRCWLAVGMALWAGCSSPTAAPASQGLDSAVQDAPLDKDTQVGAEAQESLDADADAGTADVVPMDQGDAADGQAQPDQAAELDQVAQQDKGPSEVAPADAGDLADAAPPKKPPIAVIACTAGSGIPGGTASCAGTNSQAFGACAPIQEYQWSGKTPAGPWAWTSKTPGVPPSVLPDFTAGENSICLQVVDSCGQTSTPTCEKFLVIPNNDIHIDLTWDTPNDPDQTDNGPAAGADLDLHFAHAQAALPDQDCDGQADPWFSNPFDAFWYNPNPSWNAAGLADDPLLAMEDTDGAGPESIYVAKSAGTAQQPEVYAIGVHYWDDHGYGPSWATVAVYLQGVLAYKSTPVQLAPGDMWHVGQLTWPNTMSGGSAAPLKICKQIGQSCPAKMWQSAGDPCVTPCYLATKGLFGPDPVPPANCKKP